MRYRFVSLEGYLIGRLVVEALGLAGPDITRDKLLTTIYEVGKFDLDGLTLVFGPNDNQGLDRVFMTVIGPQGRFHRVGDPHE